MIYSSVFMWVQQCLYTKDNNIGTYFKQYCWQNIEKIITRIKGNVATNYQAKLTNFFVTSESLK